ncbi:hypothetical protein IQ07DRAFT_638167 [Pyrenochaeta sp. DS3sAY3a]|nr:hypothetical protein IQ07DRAFT_638167 [Pyrenochaeta sp. DS3sAY3a]
MSHPVKTAKQDEPGIEAVSWDTFPPVPPGAEDWQPDPDTISKPGPFRDIRFRQDAAEYRAARLIETQGRMHGFSQGKIAAIKKAVLPSYEGRIYSSQEDHEGVPAPSSNGLEQPSLQQSQDRLGTKFSEVPGSQPASTVDGGVENLRKSPEEEQNPLALNKSAPSLPSTQANASAPSLSSAQANTSAPTRSIPPHLRKKTVQGNATKSSSNEPAKVIDKSNPVSTEAGKQTDVPAPGRSIPPHLRKKAVPGNATRGSANESTKVINKSAPVSAIPEQDPQPQVGSGGILDYSRYLKFKIITMIEEDMRLERRLAEQDVLPMSNKDMQDYMLELSKQHELWWNEKQNGVS